MIHTIDTTDSDKQGFEKNTEHIEKEILNTSGQVRKVDHNTKIAEIVNKVPSVTGLVTAALSTKATD